MMERCPKCGRWLIQKIKYSNGNPIVHKTCVCGYDNLRRKIIYDNKTERRKYYDQ